MAQRGGRHDFHRKTANNVQGTTMELSTLCSFACAQCKEAYLDVQMPARMGVSALIGRDVRAESGLRGKPSESSSQQQTAGEVFAAGMAGLQLGLERVEGCPQM